MAEREALVISDRDCRELFGLLEELTHVRSTWPTFRFYTGHCFDVVEPELGRLEVLRWIERRWPGLEVHELVGALSMFDRALERELVRVADVRTDRALARYAAERERELELAVESSFLACT